MARVPYLDASDAPPETRERLSARPINLFRALAHHPRVLDWMAGIGAWIRYECDLDPRLRELAILQVGYLTRSAYEFTHHVQIGLSFGVTLEDVHALTALGRGEDVDLDPEARLVLEAARQLTEGTELDDSTWEALISTLGVARVLELIFVITHYVQVVRVLGALEIDVEPEYEQYRPLLEGGGR